MTTNVNNGQNDTILCIHANQMNLVPNNFTTVFVNGVTVASGHCLSVTGREVIIPEESQLGDEIEFVFQQ